LENDVCATRVCLNTIEPLIPDFETPSDAQKYLGDVVIHEFAHHCGWNHGMGEGVPQDPGPDKKH